MPANVGNVSVSSSTIILNVDQILEGNEKGPSYTDFMSLTVSDNGKTKESAGGDTFFYDDSDVSTMSSLILLSFTLSDKDKIKDIF